MEIYCVSARTSVYGNNHSDNLISRFMLDEVTSCPFGGEQMIRHTFRDRSDKSWHPSCTSGIEPTMCQKCSLRRLYFLRPVGSRRQLTSLFDVCILCHGMRHWYIQIQYDCHIATRLNWDSQNIGTTWQWWCIALSYIVLYCIILHCLISCYGVLHFVTLYILHYHTLWYIGSGRPTAAAQCLTQVLRCQLSTDQISSVLLFTFRFIICKNKKRWNMNYNSPSLFASLLC